MQEIRCFIFDLDGTLVFNGRANFLAYQAAFKSAGLELAEADFEYHFKVGGNIKEIYADFVQKHGLPGDSQQLAAIKATKIKEYAKRFDLIDQNHGMISLLKSLSKHYHTALATTAKKQNGQGVLEHFGLTKLFDFMVFADDVTKLKPDPECYQKIANHFGVNPDECIIFEDSAKGFAAAEAFGSHVCKVMK